MSLEEPSYKQAYDKLFKKKEKEKKVERIRAAIVRRINPLAEILPGYSADDLQAIGLNLFYL